jgi:hypothetical protein
MVALNAGGCMKGARAIASWISIANLDIRFEKPEGDLE